MMNEATIREVFSDEELQEVSGGAIIFLTGGTW
jgi:hypothetical protein